MLKTTIIALSAYVSQLAILSGAPTPGDSWTQIKFTVDPTVQQKLENKTQESSGFLQSINMITVVEQEGEKLGLGIGGPVASRTNTSTNDRVPTDPTSLEQHTYRCEKTNSDTLIKYAKLDAWAKFKDFQTRIRDLILKRQALDRIMIGWNGTSVAATTDKTANPLLQDVNIGWLQQIRLHAEARWMKRGGVAANGVNKIYVSETGTHDYTTLDGLVFDAVQLLDPWAQDDTELVVIVGRDLLNDKYFPIIDKAANTATEVVARDQVLKSAKQIGGLPAVRVPFFPANAILITRLDNLSIYAQEGTRRRTIVDNAKRDQIENYESWNEAYVVEDYGYCALVENIVLGPKPA